DRERSTDAGDARTEYVKRLTDAWRTPARDPAQGSKPEELMRRHVRTDPDDDAQARKDASWEAYREQLGNAWKNPPGVTRAETAILGGGPRSVVVKRADPSGATRIERQGEQWRGGR